MNIQNADRLWIVVIHYNNPEALTATLDHLLGHGFDAARIAVYDNGSQVEKHDAALALCASLGCEFVPSEVNRGWGGAINDFLRSRAWDESDLLLISAHDARIVAIDLADIEHEFRAPRCLFVSPRTVDNLDCYYGMAHSFWVRRASSSETRQVQIGHATACVARPAALARLGFDEEYFIYGCESEIFLRAADQGYVTMLPNSFVVDNPSTDSNSEFCVRAFAINSMYTAWKRHGLRGALVRGGALLASAARLRMSGQRQASRIKVGAVVYGLRHPRRGLRTYLRSQQVD